MERRDFIGLMVGGDAVVAFEVSDEENQSDEKGRNGQSFQGGAFHGI